MIYYINAYQPDTLALFITVARVHELDPQAVVYIASDQAAPVIGTIPGANVITTTYPRGGNLRGSQCVIGMLQTMEAILQHHGGRHIVKLDADTYLNSLEWLHPDTYREECKGNQPDFVAMERADAFSVSGDCYRVSIYGIRAALRHIRHRVQNATRHQKPEDLPEDVTISNAILRERLPVYTVPFFHGLHRGLNFSMPTGEHRRAAVIHCGEPLANGARAPREMVYLRLQTMWHLTHPAGTPIPAPGQI